MLNLSMSSLSHSAMTWSSLYESCDSPSVTITMTFFTPCRAPRSGVKASLLICRHFQKCYFTCHRSMQISTDQSPVSWAFEGLSLITWQYQYPGRSWSWGRSPVEVHPQIPAEQECCQTGSGWRCESHFLHRTQCQPGTHRHIFLHHIYLCFSLRLRACFCFSLLRMWSALIWHNALYTDGRGLQQPWKMWLTTTKRHSDKTFQCFPLENSTSLWPDQCNHNKN